MSPRGLSARIETNTPPPRKCAVGHSRSPFVTALLAGALMLALSCAGCAPTQDAAHGADPFLRPGMRSGELVVNGYLRTWTVYVPPGIAATSTVPLVVAVHGAASSGRGFIVDWVAEADRRGFIVVAPDGLPAYPDKPVDAAANPRIWNDGRLPDLGPRSHVDDVAFVRAMLDRLDAELPIDRGRTYAAGHSNGGGMVFRLAAEASDRLAAIAVVASVPWVDERLARPVPTLVLVGTRDPLVPLAGGVVHATFASEVRPPFHAAMLRWASDLGMPLPAVRVAIDDAHVRVEQWTGTPGETPGGSAGARITIVYVKGQGHGWPGVHNAGLPETTTGPIPQTVDATAKAWRFFEAAPPR
jgi:polyhydroxybutyrate depolymerase